MPKDVTAQEFEKELLEFMRWTSSQPRPLSGWYVSLETWAAMQFSEAYKRDYPHAPNH